MTYSVPRIHYFVVMSFALWCVLASGRSEAVQRAYVASYGLDSNTSFGCDVTRPCRFFQAATTVVDPNGEVVVLDSGGYGGVTLTQSIALIAPPGVYAGISVFPYATGVDIVRAGVNVVLRGLTINGLGGRAGVSMSDGASLSIENCVIANFDRSYGIIASTAAKVSITNTLLRNNNHGIIIQGGAAATISRTTVVGSNRAGISVEGQAAGTSSATISDSIVSGSRLLGIYAHSSNPNATALVSIIRSKILNGGDASYGVTSHSNTGTALLTISESIVMGNLLGLSQFNPGATLESLGNNTVRQNTTNSYGSITATAPL